jgi:hypothetical protein
MIPKQRVFILLIVGISTWNLIAESVFGVVSTRYFGKAKQHELLEPVALALPVTISGPAGSSFEPYPSESFRLSSPAPDGSIRFLWGIPTVAGDHRRRQLVRETYLSFYTQSATPHRICSLVDVLDGNVSLGAHEGACEITYVFFIGGNPTGPCELTKPNASYPILIKRSDVTDYPKLVGGSRGVGVGGINRMLPLEGDVISLNVRENLEDGKSQTWFKYASMVVKDNPWLQIDYIAKVDSDTLVFTPTFLGFAKRRLPRQPHNQRVYGGLPHDKNACNPKVNDTHSCPLELKGGLYMAGSLYWMSPDLAEYITSDAVDRRALSIGHEDVDIGNFVFSHPLSIRTVKIESRRALNHRNFDMGWRRKPRTTTFRGVLFGHSEDGFFPGPFFKSPRIYRKMWRSFEGFWQAGAGSNHLTMEAFDLYQLFDIDEVRPERGTSAQVGNSTQGRTNDATPLSGVRVQLNDYIYSDSDFDSSPIVMESHKLIFFTVAGVGDDIWRRLFRRMMGYKNWKTDEVYPSQQSDDGLRRLYDYSVEEASAMMSSPDFTRAIFIRDPRSRLLAAYRNKVVGGPSPENNDGGDGGRRLPYILMACCGGPASCDHGTSLPKYCQRACNNDTIEFSRFLKFAIHDCDQPWWRPQSRQMEPRFYSSLNFVGHYQNMAREARDLLERIGAWEEFGKEGWGPLGNESIFFDTAEMQEDLVQGYYRDKEIQKLYKPFEVYDTVPISVV